MLGPDPERCRRKSSRRKHRSRRAAHHLPRGAGQTADTHASEILDHRLLAADAVVNVGYRPTFGENQYWVEAYLLDFSGDLYDRTLRLEFLDRIRPEMKFSGVDALKRQVMSDIATARAHRGGRAAS